MFAWMNLMFGIFASLSFASLSSMNQDLLAKTFPFGILVDNILVNLPEPHPASRTISFPFQFICFITSMPMFLLRHGSYRKLMHPSHISNRDICISIYIN